MSGVGVDGFDPYGATARGMLISILWRLEGKSDAGIALFLGVTRNLYYVDVVVWRQRLALLVDMMQ